MPVNYSVTDSDFMSDLNELMDALTSEAPEPSVEIKHTDGERLMSIKSSGIEYNRNKFPHDTYEQAAKKLYDTIRPKKESMRLDFSFELSQWMDFPRREFSLTKAGLDHNFDVDTWHWWLLNELEKMVKQTPS